LTVGKTGNKFEGEGYTARGARSFSGKTARPSKGRHKNGGRIESEKLCTVRLVGESKWQKEKEKKKGELRDNEDHCNLVFSVVGAKRRGERF